MVDIIIEEKLKEAGLTESKIKRIVDLISEMLTINSSSANPENVERCPKCGKLHPVLTKGGKTVRGAQMYRCKDYGKRFVLSHGHMTFRSHQDESIWREMIKHCILIVLRKAAKGYQ